jgi:hypothetical protein
MTPQQQYIVDSVRSLIGASLNERCDELCQLIGRGVDDGRSHLSSKVSDCGLFALGIWKAVGIDHELLGTSYVTGMAIAWVVKIATEKNAVRHVKQDGLPVPGALMHYYSPRPSQNDHVEFCLSEPTPMANHAGGGRANCAIGEDTGNILWNCGRPLQCWYDPEALLA